MTLELLALPRLSMLLQHYKIPILMNVKVSEKSVSAKLPISLDKLTSVMADFAIAYESEQSLGYYPSFDYLIQSRVLPEELHNLFESSCQIISYAATVLLQNKLKAAFSQVHVLETYHIARNIPVIRPQDENAHEKLAAHYLPNYLHVRLELSQIQKTPVSPDYESFARRLVYRWLSDSFEDIEITVSSFESD